MKKNLKEFLLALFCLSIANVGIAEGEQDNVALGLAKSSTCVACHAKDGNSVVNTFPKIAGQNERYLLKELKDFKLDDKGGRNNPVMYGIVATYSDAEFENLAAYYSAQKATVGIAKAEQLDLGQRLYRGGDRTRQIVACMACHGPRGDGNMLAAFPALSGQFPEYTIAQLKSFRDGQRKNDPNSMMRDIASKLTDKDMEAVANYVYGLH